MSDSSRKTAPSRRRIMRTSAVGALAAAAATMAAPQVSRAETTTWRFQSTWATKDIFHEFCVDYAAKVGEMSGGRLRLDVLPAGAVAQAAQMQTSVAAGTIDGGHGVCSFWYAKHRASALFGTPPAFGWDAHNFLAWFYRGGGEALYKELLNDILKLNVVGYLYFPMPTQPLGWFKKEIKGPEDFKDLKLRTTGIATELFKELGAAVTLLGSGEVVPAMERGLVDAAEFNNPSSDLQMGFAEVSKFYMMQSQHQPVETFEVIFNRSKVEALPKELQAILRWAALAASTDQHALALDRYARDLEALKAKGVSVLRTPESVLEAQLKAWEKVIDTMSKDPRTGAFFAKVVEAQKAWCRRTLAYSHINSVNGAMAHRHFFG